jgi:hypothetical protein
MKQHTGKMHADRLRKLASEIKEEADSLERSACQPLFYNLNSPPYEEVGPSFGVGYDSYGQVITFQDHKLTYNQMKEIALGAIWALFESQRASNHPGDPIAFEKVMAEINDGIRHRCFQEE